MALPRDIFIHLFSVIDNKYDKARLALTCKNFYEIYDNLRERTYSKSIKCRAQNSTNRTYFRFIINQDVEYTIASPAYYGGLPIQDCTNENASEIAQEIRNSQNRCMYLFGLLEGYKYDSSEYTSRRTLKPSFAHGKLWKVQIWIHARCRVEISEEGNIMHDPKFPGDITYALLYEEYRKYIKHAPISDFVKNMYLEMINFIYEHYWKNRAQN